MTIYLIEIPHQLTPKLWTRESKEEVISFADQHLDYDRVNEIIDFKPVPVCFDDEGEPIEWSARTLDLDDAIKVIGDDLSALIVFTSEEEARAALADDKFWIRHGGAKAFDLLKAELEGGA